MTIERANSSGWKQNKDTLTSDQINTIDTNTTYAVDKRSGETDTIESTLTVSNNGSITFADGSSLTIDPESLVINDGVLTTDAEIKGSDTNPLRFGFSSITISSSSKTLTADEYSAMVIRFTGTLTADTTVTFPSVSGYIKYIDNQTNGNFNLFVKGADGDNLVQINQSKQKAIYCDGVDLNEATNVIENGLIQYEENHNTSAFNTTISSPTATSFTLVSGYNWSFSNVQVGDFFEITYHARITAAASDEIQIGVYVSEESGDNVIDGSIFSNTTTTPISATMITRYDVTTATDHTVGLAIKSVGGGTATLASPLSINVKHIRP